MSFHGHSMKPITVYVFWLNGRPSVLILQLNASHSFNCTVKQLLYLHSHQAKYMLLSKYQFCRMSLNDLKCQWFCQCCQRCSWDFGPDSSFQDSTMQNGELPKQRTATNGIVKNILVKQLQSREKWWRWSCLLLFCFVNYTPKCFHTKGARGRET